MSPCRPVSFGLVDFDPLHLWTLVQLIHLRLSTIDFPDDLSEGATLPYYTLELEDKKKKVPGLLALVFIDETANTAGGVVFNTRLRQLVEVPLEKLPRGKPTLDKEGLRAADEALQVRVYGARGREGPGWGT